MPEGLDRLDLGSDKPLPSEELEHLLEGFTPEEIASAVGGLSHDALALLLGGSLLDLAPVPDSPAAQAQQLDEKYLIRPHLAYLSERLVQAVVDVENGRNRHLLVSMPPRSGKSTLISFYLVVWLLRKHADWSFILTSHDGGLATSWGRAIQQTLVNNPSLGLTLARNPSAASEWATTSRGSVLSRGIRGSITGRGAKVLVIDDPVKDFVDAHSPLIREGVWNWWLTTSQPRLEPPYLVLVVMTRWHEDDFAGRLLSGEHAGVPEDWEVIRLPALADSEDDVLGREIGEPLLSPLIPEETPATATQRWEDTRRSVGSYAFASMYQQRPAPAQGAIFDISWWRFWTTDPSRATEDGRVVHLDPGNLVGRWIDSWDCAFKGSDDSDYVVAQRWASFRSNYYLVAQKRGKWAFTQTLAQMKEWTGVKPDNWDEPILGPFDPYDHRVNPWGRFVHERLIEEAANGAAVIDTLKEHVTGLTALTKRAGKEVYARAVAPDIESGHVYLPHPGDPGNLWVHDLLGELRNFPHDAHDDQVDALTQALLALRGTGKGSIAIPGRLAAARANPAFGGRVSIGKTAATDLARRRG